MSAASAVARIGAIAGASAETGRAALSSPPIRHAASNSKTAASPPRDTDFITAVLLARFSKANVDRALRCREKAPEHRFEELQRCAVIGRIERRLVVELAEPRGIREISVAAERLAHVAVEADVMEEIIALEDAVLLGDP